jgi:hypothetical protein
VDDLWALLGDPRIQATLSWVGGGLAALAGGAWAVVKFLASQKSGGGAAPSAASVEAMADRGGVAAGRDVSVRVSHGLSGLPVVLLVLAVVGAVLVAGGLLGGRITATQGGVAIGGDVSGSTVTGGGPATKP